MEITVAGTNDIRKLVTLIFDHYGKVENKSGAEIRNELTKSEVVNALGYTPSDAGNNFDEDGTLEDTD